MCNLLVYMCNLPVYTVIHWFTHRTTKCKSWWGLGLASSKVFHTKDQSVGLLCEAYAGSGCICCCCRCYCCCCCCISYAAGCVQKHWTSFHWKWKFSLKFQTKNVVYLPLKLNMFSIHAVIRSLLKGKEFSLRAANESYKLCQWLFKILTCEEKYFVLLLDSWKCRS